jgi:LysM repeat protein
MKFVVLAVIFVGVIVVVALTRPFIFNHVVPVVMGEGQLTAPMPVEELEENVEEAYPVEETVLPVVEDTAVEAAYPVENEVVSEVELPTAVATISHTVQPGDTMINIARRYSVTVEAIIAANNISNPNHIEVGMTLLIPHP